MTTEHPEKVARRLKREANVLGTAPSSDKHTPRCVCVLRSLSNLHTQSHHDSAAASLYSSSSESSSSSQTTSTSSSSSRVLVYSA